MSSASESSATVYKQDGRTTYCFYTNEKYTADFSGINLANIISKTSGAACPVQLTVSFPPQVEKNKLIGVTIKAVMNDKNKPAAFEFPLTIAKAPVPAALLASSNNATLAPGGSTGAVSKMFDVPIANVVICDYRNCDLFTDSRTIKGNYYSSSNNPQDFDAGNQNLASFGSNELSLTKESKYTGYAHIVVNIAGVSRADFVTFFPVQVGNLPGTEPTDTLRTDSKTTYCWVSPGRSPFEQRIDDTSINVRSNANCPGSMTAALSKSNVLIGENVTLDFALQLEATRTPTTIVGEVSPTNTIRNPTTGVYSVVPVAVVGSCLQNSEDKSSTCSTYSGGMSRTVDLTTWSDQNMTSGIVTFSTSHAFSEPGKYSLVSRVVMQTLDGDRIDLAVYSTVQVAIPATTNGSLFLYIGLGIGALILLGGFLFCYLRKSRTRRRMKQIPFRTPVAGGGATPSVMERSSQYTASSSTKNHPYVTHRSPDIPTTYPIAYPQHDNNPSSFYPANGSHHQYDDYDERPQKQHYKQQQQHNYQQQHERSDSFSLDPYSRDSFNDAADHESAMDMTIQPSDAGKYSFQTGYDDQSDWDYDTRPSFQSDADSNLSASYSDAVQRGTFHLHSGAGSSGIGNALPIMEEDDLERRYNQPRSTTSPGWTVRS